MNRAEKQSKRKGMARRRGNRYEIKNLDARKLIYINSLLHGKLPQFIVLA